MTVHSRSVPALILFALMMRLLPHPPNLTPIGALAVFSGRLWKKDHILTPLIPILAMILSDLYLGFHPYILWVYGAFGSASLLSFLFMKRFSLQNLIFTNVLSAVVFYVVTNFGVWIQSGFYPPTGPGLVSCYWAGIPFFLTSVVGNLFYSVFFFMMEDLDSFKRTGKVGI